MLKWKFYVMIIIFVNCLVIIFNDWLVKCSITWKWTWIVWILVSSMSCDIAYMRWLLNIMIRHVLFMIPRSFPASVMKSRSFLTSFMMSRSFPPSVMMPRSFLCKCYYVEVIYDKYYDVEVISWQVLWCRGLFLQVLWC